MGNGPKVSGSGNVPIQSQPQPVDEKLPEPNQSKQDPSQAKSQTTDASYKDAGAARAKAGENKLAGNLKAAELQKVVLPKDSVIGQKIAMLGKDPVLVAKEFGPPEGFKTRYEALALARGADSKGAAIFQDGKGRWHAVETNVPLGRSGNPSWSPEPKANHLEFVDKPDLKKWAEKRDIVDKLKAQGRTLNDYELKAAYADMVATALGVPFTEVKIIDKSEDADPGKINFNPNLPAYGRAGAAKLDGKPHTLQIGIGQLGSDQPFEVISTAFHEATHIRHHDRGNELLKQWEGIKGTKPEFDEWIKQQYRSNKITLEEKVTVLGEFRGNTSPTEAISYVNGFMATFAVDRKDDRMIASELGMAASKSPGDQDMEKELINRLRNFYNGLDESDRTRFNTAMAKAKNDNPGSWLRNF